MPNQLLNKLILFLFSLIVLACGSLIIFGIIWSGSESGASTPTMVILIILALLLPVFAVQNIVILFQKSLSQIAISGGKSQDNEIENKT